MGKVNKKGQLLPWAPPPPARSRFQEKKGFDYNATLWRKASTAWRNQNPICEISIADGHEMPAQVTDHIIRIEDGGAPYDPNNFMSMSHYWHNVKRGLEKHHGTLIETTINASGELIPLRREDIFKAILRNTP